MSSSGRPVTAQSGSGSIPVTTIASSGSAQTLTFPSHGEKIIILNLTADCAITLDGSAAPEDEGTYITLLVTANGHNIEWVDSATISWANGEAPLFSGHEDQLTLLSVASGASYRGGRGWADLEGPPAPSAPTVTSAPAISGSAAAGSTLTRTVGAASGNPTPTPSTQWRKDGVAIPGQTGSTYGTADPADVGKVIDVLVTWTNGVSPDAAADSNDITVTASGGGGGAFAQMINPAPGLLTAVTAEVGGPITMHPASGGSASAVVTAAHRVRSNDALDTYYTFAGTPPSADYTVTADITRLIATVGYAGVLFRWDPTLLTGYVFRLGASGSLGEWECYRYNAGTATQMGAPVPATGSIDVAQGISLTGSGADIVASVGGVGEIFNVTDGAPILSTGKAGIFFYQATTDTNGTQLSNFAAT